MPELFRMFEFEKLLYFVMPVKAASLMINNTKMPCSDVWHFDFFYVAGCGNSIGLSLQPAPNLFRGRTLGRFGSLWALDGNVPGIAQRYGIL